MHRQPLIVGNWKMNGDLLANQKRVDALKENFQAHGPKEAVICAPFPYLDQLSRLLLGSTILLGAQDVSAYESGAYTGEVSASMLRDFGCRYVIVGHSERRSLHHESDELTAQKFGAAQTAGITPILCLGETLEERKAGLTLKTISRQLNAVLSAHGAHALAKAVLAYEPVWAIGTGQTASPEEAQAVHQAIRQRVAKDDLVTAVDLRIIYGGSLKADNAGSLFVQPDIDGGLVGGASLNADDFLAICQTSF